MAFVILVAASLILLNIYPVGVVRRQMIHSKENSLLLSADTLVSALQGYNTFGSETIAMAVDMLDVLPGGRILVVNDAFLVVYDSLKTSTLLDSVFMVPEVVTALSGRDVFRCVYDTEGFLSRASSPITHEGNIIGAVYLYQYDTQDAIMLNDMQTEILNISFLVSIACIALLSMFLSAFGRRIGNLLRGVREMRDGDYSYQIKMGGEDEIKIIADEFNELGRRLTLTEQRRREFVSDASHELKTPLAAIKLLSDSILHTEGISLTQVKEFLNDIQEEIDRLIRITESLLYLTRLDAKPIVKKEACDIAQMARKCAELLKGKAAQCDVRVSVESEGGVFVSASSDGLQQVIFNLMENAIKYNRPGGTVLVTITGDGRSVVLSVKDTGIGIMEEDLERIYERFYRVDKARSRATGGSGLGLAIASEWVTSLGGELRVKSEYQKGSEFTVTLPQWEGEV